MWLRNPHQHTSPPTAILLHYSSPSICQESTNSSCGCVRDYRALYPAPVFQIGMGSPEYLKQGSTSATNPASHSATQVSAASMSGSVM